MATNNYILKITSKGADAAYKLTYKNGKFFRLEAKRQKFVDDQRSRLMNIIPHKESQLQINSYNGVSIEKEVKQQSMFTKCLSAYTSFYNAETKLLHRMNGTEGNALKAIISHLRSVATTDDEALVLWNQILTNWDKLEPFYKKQMELRQINSNINIILIQLKDGGTSKSKAANNADELRRNL